MVGGAALGAFVSKLLPSYVISTLLVLLLGVPGRCTIRRDVKIRKAKKTTAQQHHSEETPLVQQHVATGSPRGRTSFQELQSPEAEKRRRLTASRSTGSKAGA
jgi:hypothetical protein